MKTAAARAVEMTGHGKTMENHEQVFHRFPPPLEIAARFPHSHSCGGDRAEKWKSETRIPTFPHGLLVTYKISEKEDSPERRVPRPSGSLFD
jgi:hypothetical protein